MPVSATALDRTSTLRRDFPILQRILPNGRPLIYLDNAATTQKPEAVLARDGRLLPAQQRQRPPWGAHPERGGHGGVRGGAGKGARPDQRPQQQRDHLHPRRHGSHQPGGLLRGAAPICKPGDEVLVTEMEHHANIVPWQILQEQIGFTLRFVPVTDQGTLDLDQLPHLLTERTKLFGFVHVSNVVGTVNPVQELVAAARRVGAVVLLDAAQSVPHMPVDVQALDVDFLAFSGHKMCGPTGSGALYGKRALLEAMPPFLGGGEMIREVKLTGSKWNTIPHKFEAGTPAIAEAIGLGAAVDYLQAIGLEWVHTHEQELTRYAYDRLSEVEGLRIIGPGPAQRGGLIAFTLQDVHPHDVSAILDREGIAVRAGHHCAQPLHDRFRVPATTRASFYLYNLPEEVDALVAALHRAQEVFAL